MFKRLKNSFLILSVFAFVGAGCNASIAPPPASSKPLVLEYWSVVDDFDVYEDMVNAYRSIHPNVRINYRKFRIDEYEKELINALAEDRGPDILSLHNSWIHSYKSKLLPAPRQLKLAFKELQGTLQKKAVWVEKIVPGITPGQVKNNYVDQVADDAIILTAVEGNRRTLEEKIYGLPLSVDSMALYYNRDVLNASGIPTPAQNWSEFQDHVKRGTRYDEQGKLTRPFAGIGTGNNVERSFDLLSLLMMQNGAEMTDSNGFPRFNRIPASMTDRNIPPGAEALIFYSDFANPAKEVFTWDDSQPNSFDAFIAGKTGYFFGYSYHRERIKAQAPKLNFSIASVPQIDPNLKTNYANYWLETVSKKTEHPNEAWDFLQFITKADVVKSYLEKSKKPTALRALINTQLSDDDLSVFASQTLTAKSWYKGNNIQASETAFTNLINSVLAGEDPLKVINRAADIIGQTIR